MKVLRIISSMDPKNGGPCQGIRNLIPSLKILGVDNEVLCFDSVDLDYGKEDPFVIYKIGPAVGPYAYTKLLRSWLTDNIDRYQILIIHGLWLYNSYGTYRVWKSLTAGTKFSPELYVMPHGMLDPYFQNAPERKLKALRNKIFWYLFEKRVVNQSNGVLFTCQRELELARKTFSGYKPRKELNVGYGVQPPPSYNKEMEIAFWQKINISKTKYLLFLSRVHEKKGVDLLIEAYVQIQESDRDVDFPILVIAGPIDSDFAKALVKRYSHRTDVVFVGMLQGDTKWGAIYGCEVFILPSHQENFGIAVVEAMACRKPVAITNQVNIYTVIDEWNAGYVFEDNLESAKKVLSLILKEIVLGKLESRGNKARIAYEENYQPDRAAKQLVHALCQK